MSPSGIMILARKMFANITMEFLWMLCITAFGQNNQTSHNNIRILDEEPTPLELARNAIYMNRIALTDHSKTYQEYEDRKGKLILKTNQLRDEKGYCTRETQYTSKGKLLYHYKLIAHDSIGESLTYIITHLKNKRLKKPDTVQVKYGRDNIENEKELKYREFLDSLNNSRTVIMSKEDSIQVGSLKIVTHRDFSQPGNVRYFISNNRIGSSYLCYGEKDEMILGSYDCEFKRQIYNTCLKAYETYHYSPIINDKELLTGYRLASREVSYITNDSCKINDQQYYYDEHKVGVYYDRPYEGYKEIQAEGYYESIQYTKFDQVLFRTVVISTYYE